ncbi:MAG TPA: sulfotransferase family 2 domain-containing protein [Parafilimonas sp.]|nr:sulfotransferase family 2 domain-containing protein [Parafilimonas sp.]
MVISDKYKYLFIEMYNTGSTSISNELCEFYDGKRILRKHSRYHEFLKTATEEQKKYFVFSGIRNPMDTVISVYSKFANNHKGKYTDPQQWRKNGGYVKDKRLQLFSDIKNAHLTFQEYFLKYYKVPYDRWSRLDHEKFDYIIRYENIQNDFRTVLQKLNIEPVRDLPTLNKTEGKQDYTNYYTPDIQKRAVFVFGPFMDKWGYSFPDDWNVKRTPLSSTILFSLLGFRRNLIWRQKDKVKELKEV